MIYQEIITKKHCLNFSDFLFGDISITGNMNTNSLCIICAIFKDGYRYTLNLFFSSHKLRKVYFNVTRLDWLCIESYGYRREYG